MEWPELRYEEWKETCDTLHMWTQVVGKVKLALVPYLNEWWEVAFHFTPRGLTTGPIPFDERTFDVRFDFVGDELRIDTDDGRSATLALQPRSVADFYREFSRSLADLGFEIRIDTMPVETTNHIPFDTDETHRSYDAGAVHRWWRIMLSTYHVFERWRSPFVGKSSPVQFFWGSFDLSEVRFSGRPATPPAGTIMRYAEDQQNFAAGFWPGDEKYPHAAFYTYTYPEPDGFRQAHIQPSEASYDETLGEFLLPYDDLRRSASPEEAITQFLQTTYVAAANLGKWDRDRLERTP